MLFFQHIYMTKKGKLNHLLQFFPPLTQTHAFIYMPMCNTYTMKLKKKKQSSLCSCYFLHRRGIIHWSFNTKQLKSCKTGYHPHHSLHYFCGRSNPWRLNDHCFHCKGAALRGHPLSTLEVSLHPETHLLR